MAFIESPRFPENIEFQSSGGPMFHTTRVVVNSGFVYTNQDWQQELPKYQISEPPQTLTAFYALQACFRVAGGMANGFRVKDSADFTVVGGEGFMIATGLVTNQYQLYKRYTWGANTYDRIIQKPRQAGSGFAGNVLQKNGVTLTYGGGAGQVTYDESKGLVVFNTTPLITDTLTWTGEFDVPCRFDTDFMDCTVLDKAGSVFIMHWKSIPLVGIRIA